MSVPPYVLATSDAWFATRTHEVHPPSIAALASCLERVGKRIGSSSSVAASSIASNCVQPMGCCFRRARSFFRLVSIFPRREYRTRLILENRASVASHVTGELRTVLKHSDIEQATPYTRRPTSYAPTPRFANREEWNMSSDKQQGPGKRQADAKWAAIVDDQLVPMPRERGSAGHPVSGRRRPGNGIGS